MTIWVRTLNKKLNPFDYGVIPEVKVYHADVTEFDWSYGDFILANSTWFDPELMNKIYEKSKAWREGAWMVTLTKKLPPNEEWELMFQTKKKMSWADATINVYKKAK